MPMKRTQAKRSRRLDQYKRQQLLLGPDASLLAGVGYLTAGTFDAMSQDDQALALAEMERDWRLHRDELLAWWEAGPEADLSGQKPWIFIVPQGAQDPPWAADQFDG